MALDFFPSVGQVLSLDDAKLSLAGEMSQPQENYFPQKLIRRNFEDSTRYCCCPLHSYASKGVMKPHTQRCNMMKECREGPEKGGGGGEEEGGMF